MLETYIEEVRRKRRAHNLFWVVVFALSALLYMFFQWYYFSIEVGWEKLFRNGTETVKATGEEVVRAFGIINIRVDPNPHTLTVNDLPYRNSDKSIFDYGTYRIKIAEDGYLPIDIETTLDKNNQFYINTIELIKNPESIMLPDSFESVATIKPGTYVAKVTSASGAAYRVYDELFQTGSTIVNPTKTGALTYLWDGLFRSGDKLYSYDDGPVLKVYDKLKSSVPLCENVTSVHGNLYCPETGVFLTGDYSSLKEKVLESTDRIIRTKSTISRVSDSFFKTEYQLPANLTISGSTDIVRLFDKTLLAANRSLYDVANGYKNVEVEGMKYVSHVENFPDETLVFGRTNSGANALALIDARNNEFLLPLIGFDIDAELEVTKHSGAYIISNGKRVIVYYKGGTGVTKLAEWTVLWIFNRTILVRDHEWKTSKIVLQGVE